MKYQRVLDAVVRRAEHLSRTESKDLWDIADELLRAVPERDVPFTGTKEQGRQPLSDAETEEIEAIARMLEKHGYPDYQPNTLMQMRDIALTFPTKRRYPELTFWTHREARNPEFLDWAIRKKRGVENITVVGLRDLRNSMIEAEREARKERVEVAKKTLRSTADPAERAKAQRQIDENIGPPKSRTFKVAKEHESDVERLAEVIELGHEVENIADEMRDHLKRLRALRGRISEDLLETFADDYGTIKQVADQIIAFLDDTKRQRFTVVQGGKKHA